MIDVEYIDNGVMCMKAGVTICDKDKVCRDTLEREIKY